MKTWMQKLIEQFELGSETHSDPKESSQAPVTYSEEQATLIFLLDTYSKHLFDLNTYPIRKARETIEDFAKEIIAGDPAKSERTYFRLRQFFHSYRVDEYSYVQKTFDDFRQIVWDFVDQLSDDKEFESSSNIELRNHLTMLKDAVESNSIHELKNQARSFIDSYVEIQTRKEDRSVRKVASIKKSLDTMKHQLMDAQNALTTDHLTNAKNRKYFEEKMKFHWHQYKMDKKPVTLMMIDIDFFKKINDQYGHDIGDFALIELVRIMKAHFSRPQDTVARLGGEEFAVILPDYEPMAISQKIDLFLETIRKEVYVHEQARFQFTVSLGVAFLNEFDTTAIWLKRSDLALYESKHNGRNQATVAAEKITEKKPERKTG